MTKKKTSKLEATPLPTIDRARLARVVGGDAVRTTLGPKGR